MGMPSQYPNRLQSVVCPCISRESFIFYPGVLGELVEGTDYGGGAGHEGVNLRLCVPLCSLSQPPTGGDCPPLLLWRGGQARHRLLRGESAGEVP